VRERPNEWVAAIVADGTVADRGPGWQHAGTWRAAALPDRQVGPPLV
jgi:hypothetical protein